MNVSEQIKQRLETVMLSDRSENAQVALKVLLSDITELLSSYFVLEQSGVSLTLSKTEQSYTLNMQAKIEIILDTGSLLE